jgi:hypothetical protein
LQSEEFNEVPIEFKKYFEATYIRETGQVGRLFYFPPYSWNQYQRTKDSLPRTNNSVEGWHNSFGKNIPAHPTLAVLSRFLQIEDTRGTQDIEKFHAGLLVPQSRKKYREKDMKIKAIVDGYSGINDNIFSYLKKVGRTIKL